MGSGNRWPGNIVGKVSKRWGQKLGHRDEHENDDDDDDNLNWTHTHKHKSHNLGEL